LSKRNKEGVAIGSLHERLKGRAAPREAGQASKPREVICGGVGVSQQTKDKPHWLLVESRVLEAIGVGRRGHRQAPKARYLGVRHSDPTANTGRKNRFSLEEARYHLLARFNEIGLLEELAESAEELRPLADIGRDQHHGGIQLL
jgi:hypothetical protein